MSEENKTLKKAMTVALALCLEFFALSVGGIYAGRFIGDYFGDHGNEGSIVGFVLASLIWTWRLISTKRYIL